LKVHALVKTSQFNAFTLVLQRSGLLDIGQDGDFVGPMVFISISTQYAKLMTQHIKFNLDVGSIFLG